MIGLLDALKIGAGAILGAVLFAGPSYLYGVREGKTAAATAALEKTVELIQSRERTNAEISSADAASLCAHFELPDTERLECVRWVAAASTEP